MHLALIARPLHANRLDLGNLCSESRHNLVSIGISLSSEKMSEVHNDDAGAHGGKAPHDALEKVALEAAKGKDGRKQVLVLVDFDARHVFRALFHVPVARSKGLATLSDGRVVNEKQLAGLGDFLSLKERVEFRHRVVCVGNTFLVPRWDLDGPDMRFFGEWNPPADKVHTASSLTAGPWILDGRMLVADARDMTLLMAEAALALRGADTPVTLQILSPVPMDFESQRGWKLARGPFDAWWSGVRKAADTLATLCPTVKIVAVDDTNPFAECTRTLHVTWSKTVDESQVVCVPCDPFAFFGGSQTEQQRLALEGLPAPALAGQLMMGLMTGAVPVRVSTLVPSQRHVVWNPKTRLSVLNPKPENK